MHRYECLLLVIHSVSISALLPSTIQIIHNESHLIIQSKANIDANSKKKKSAVIQSAINRHSRTANCDQCHV